ncbi:MAG TPA: hypothetical protein VHE36_05150, partial [Sphingomicrobium sp.]|nr:hypothetical protein [Sphingomicrobium sp.]
MTTTQRRIALLTGASLATLVTAVPAYAAPGTTAPHSNLADGTYPGATTAADTVEICDLATPAGSPCFFGVIDTTGATSTAVLNSFLSGQINQGPGSGTATLSNNGSAEFGAIASAKSGLGGNATANATAINIAWQTDVVTADANYNVDNEGRLLFDAVAIAAATGATGSAFANAHLNGSAGGVMRQAVLALTGDVTLDFTNAGTLTFAAIADASAPSEA